MKKNYKKLVFYMFGLGVCVSLLFAFGIWFKDPLRIFHKPFVCKEQMLESMRFNAHWVIRDLEVDSLVIGDSKFMNFSAKSASALLGGKFFNFSAPSLGVGERFTLLNYAFRNKNIKKVVYGLGGNIFEQVFESSQYNFLYDEDKLNDYRIYLNTRILPSLLSLKCSKTDLDIPDPLLRAFDKTQGLPSWLPAAKRYAALELLKPDENDINISQNELDFMKKNLDDYVLNFARNNPNTQFYFVVPPLPRVGDVILFNKYKKSFYLNKYMIEYVLKQNLSNVKLFAFGNMDFVEDLTNYSDTDHFVRQTSTFILEEISKNEGLLSQQNFESWWNEYENKIKNYDYTEFKNEVMKFLNY